MFILTAKLRRRPIIACSLILGCLVTGIGISSARGNITPTSQSYSHPRTTNIKTTTDQIEFLTHYGWILSEIDPQVEELLLPDEFDTTYQQYLDLQLSQGFDLAVYSGKRVKRYTYQVCNHPSGDDHVQAGLLIYQNEVIAGEILSSQLGGFIHALSMPT